MVTMSSEKSASRRKSTDSNVSVNEQRQQNNVEDKNNKIENAKTKEETKIKISDGKPKATATCAEDSPNYLVYKKVSLVYALADPNYSKLR